MMDTMLGHNRSATADAEDLIDTFSRVPAELDADTVGRAITLAKQMRLAADELDKARKEDTAELRKRLADLERPYKLAHERLEDARREMLERLGAWLQKAGKRQEKNEFGLQVYQKVRVWFVVDDAGRLPPQYTRIVADTAAIERALRAGYEIPGVRPVEKISTIVV